MGDLLHVDAGKDRARARALAEERIAALNAKIADLQEARDALRRLANDCAAEGAGSRPIIAAFAGEGVGGGDIVSGTRQSSVPRAAWVASSPCSSQRRLSAMFGHSLSCYNWGRREFGMTQACIAVLALTALMVMSLRANQRFLRERRLPMQWSLAGSVNWTAPRPLALAFTPALAAIVLAATTIASLTTASRRGQEGEVVPAILAMSLCFVAVHALHLWLIGRTMKKRS